MSKPTSDEWDEFVSRHSAGDVLTGEVVSVVPFGAFVRVEPGFDGLAPKAEWPELPEEGATVQVRILEIDPERRRMSFGKQ